MVIKIRPWLYGGLVTSVVVFSSLFNSVTSEAASPHESDSPRLSKEAVVYDQVYTVEYQPVGSAISTGGVIVPYKEITFAAQLPGRVELIAGKEGSYFRRNTVLVKLGANELKAQRAQVVAQLQQAHSAMQNAHVQYHRELHDPQPSGMWDAMAPGFMPGPFGNFFSNTSGVERSANLYSYHDRVQSARAAYLQAQSKLREIDSKLRDTQSIAPFDGVILKKYVETGDPVQPGQPLITYGDTRRLQLQADVAARLAVGLREGMEVMARLDDAAKSEVPVKVAQIFPTADPVRHTIRVKFALPEGVPARAGMYAEALISDVTTSQQEMIVIPTAAIVYRGGLPMARVVLPEGDSVLRMLRLGDAAGDDRVVVLTGLRAGDKVVLQEGE